jgi:signal peptidase I
MAMESRTERQGAGPLVVALLFGPLSHIMVGQWRRACGWYAAEMATAAAAFVAAWLESPRAFWLALVMLLLLRVCVLVDVRRVPVQLPVPRPRLLVIVGLGVAIFYDILGMHVRTNFVEAFSVPSASMYPTIDAGDHIYVKKTDGPFKRGDVVVFRHPTYLVDYVKRIVAVGGDVVAGSDDGTLSVNGHPIERRRLDEPCDDGPTQGPCALWQESLGDRSWPVALAFMRPSLAFGPVTVPAGHYFLLGDNRDNSSDSRAFGPIAAEMIKGRASFVWWSRGPRGVRWGRINQPVR